MDVSPDCNELDSGPLAASRTDEAASDTEAAEVRKTTDVLLWSMQLCSLRRYFHQRFWEEESREAEYASRIEAIPRLESVAEHCWHVADSVLLIGPSFDLDLCRCLQLAVLHDKMEITIGDKSPIGRSGTGSSTHAFNEGKRLKKEDLEREAISAYLAWLPAAARRTQAPIFFELLNGHTNEVHFVRAIDKLQALAFVISKKKGVMHDKHLKFTLRYSAKAVEYYPALEPYYRELRSRLLKAVAKVRKQTALDLELFLDTVQLSLSLDEA